MHCVHGARALQTDAVERDMYIDKDVEHKFWMPVGVAALACAATLIYRKLKLRARHVTIGTDPIGVRGRHE